MDENRLALFQGKQIRRVLQNGEWWFSIIDVIGVLTESDRPRKYWSDLKTKIIREGYVELSEKIGQLKLTAPDGKKYPTDCGNTETILRIIQTIPSTRAEPLKRWLAKVGYERGGNVAGIAREKAEQELGHPVVSPTNYLHTPEKQKQLQ